LECGAGCGTDNHKAGNPKDGETMRRRDFIGGLGAGLAVVSLAPAARADSRMVLYVGAPDCPYCRQWEMHRRDAFVAGLKKNGIGFRELIVTTLRDVRRETDWPDDIKWVRNANPDMRGTPWFFLLNDQVIEKSAWGTADWETALASPAS
jgi:hypothetical protein